MDIPHIFPVYKQHVKKYTMDNNTRKIPFERSPEAWSAIEEHLTLLEAYGDEELITHYNTLLSETEVETGLAPWLFALRQTFLRRFNRSPIGLIGQDVISCIGPVIYDPEDGYQPEPAMKTSQQSDQQMLSRFMQGLKGENSFDDLDDDVQRWWINRY